MPEALLTHSGVFTSNVINHYTRHQNGDDVDKACRWRSGGEKAVKKKVRFTVGASARGLRH